MGNRLREDGEPGGGALVMMENRTQADEQLRVGEAGTGKRTRRLPAPSLAALLGLVWLGIALYPVYYMFITTLRSRSEFLEASPWLPPLTPTLENYVFVLITGSGGRKCVV